MTLSNLDNWVMVVLFALALSGMLGAAWRKARTSPRVIIPFIFLVMLAGFDAWVIVTQNLLPWNT